MEVIGIHSGFVGLLNKDIQSFDERSLSGILNLGGTILGTSVKNRSVNYSPPVKVKNLRSYYTEL